MNELIKKILNELNINEKNGLASNENYNTLSTYQCLFYTQAKNKIGVDAVYFLRDEDGIAKIPLIYFSMVIQMIPLRPQGYIAYRGIWVKPPCFSL